MLCDAFGQDIKKVKSSEEKRIIQELISIFKENDIEKLKGINLDENYNNYIGTMNIVPNLKNIFLEMYKETLYQPKEDDYIGSQTVKIKGMKKSNVQIYNVLGKENNNADFNMILTSLGGIFPYGHDFSNFKSDWDRTDSNHTISCSYIGNNSLALTNDDLLLGEDSSEEIGREFGLKVLDYYNHPNKDIAILKADLNKEYYPIEQILGGESKGLGDLYNRGLNTIKNK